LRGLKEFDAPYVITKSNFLAVIDPDICTGCGVCAEERCPVGAMAEDGDVYKALDERCIGCGLCVPVCPVEAITMEKRPEDQRDSPPGNLLRWSLKKAANRGIKFGK
jgi:NAD-dependent dihydropyrimidine dehydrogenase PreA subunit